MEFLSIIIDRVQSTNVFNIIQGRLPTRDTHLQTIVDDDLIEEFLGEIERMSRISNSITEQETALLSVNVEEELRRIGETFFFQIFPERIQERLRSSEQGYLFLHTDFRLRYIPWELLHDGQRFLAEKFFIGKNVSGNWLDVARPERERLRVLIVADPTEDLEWARQEGEGLYESLNAELSADRLDVHFMTGRRITKLNLLNAIKEKDIIHYSGHTYFSPEQQERGWLLADNKVLRAREIEKAGLAPDLVFSNSCMSSPHGSSPDGRDLSGGRSTDLASAFLRANIGSYVGTNWEIKDSGNSYNFALQFYRAIFEEKSVGEALFEARLFSRRAFSHNDLTWANYVLHGNPMTRIYRSAGKPTFDASRNQLNARRIIESYPTPIAQSYRNFLVYLNGGESARECLHMLIRTFRQTVWTLAAIIFGFSRFAKLEERELEDLQNLHLSDLLAEVYHRIRIADTAEVETAAPGIHECLLLHREQIQKLISWTIKTEGGELTEETCEAHLVTFQYLFDNFLSDLIPLSRYQLIYLDSDGEIFRKLQGLEAKKRPAVIVDIVRQEEIRDLLRESAGEICFYNGEKQLIYSLQGFLDYHPGRDEILFSGFEERKILN